MSKVSPLAEASKSRLNTRPKPTAGVSRTSFVASVLLKLGRDSSRTLSEDARCHSSHSGSASDFTESEVTKDSEREPSQSRSEGTKNRTKNTVESVTVKLLAIKNSGQPYASQGKLAKSLGCSRSTVNKALRACEELRDWMDTPKSVAARQIRDIDLARVVSAHAEENLVTEDEIPVILDRFRRRHSHTEFEQVESHLTGLEPLEKRKFATNLQENLDNNEGDERKQRFRKKSAVRE